uniref:Uncharacterized protein n=1 Tax=Rhipicephalus zambeziensis TaxID=60191 RepID=A0A224Y5R2_9ACAR
MANERLHYTKFPTSSAGLLYNLWRSSARPTELVCKEQVQDNNATCNYVNSRFLKLYDGVQNPTSLIPQDRLQISASLDISFRAHLQDLFQSSSTKQVLKN